MEKLQINTWIEKSDFGYEYKFYLPYLEEYNSKKDF